MTSRQPPGGGGKRPPYLITPDYADKSSPEAEGCWLRRRELFEPYERQMAESPLQLSLGALAFANLVDQVASEPQGCLRGADLLPPDLGRYLNRERGLVFGGSQGWPVTEEEIDLRRGGVAEKWIARALGDPWFVRKVAPWVPELEHATLSGDPATLPIVRAVVIKQCLPVQVTLRQPAVKRLFAHDVQPLLPAFIPVTEHLSNAGVSSEASRILAGRWRRQCYSDRGVLFTPKTFKAELKAARTRYGR